MEKVFYECGIVPHPNSYFVIPMKQVSHLQIGNLQSTKLGKKQVVLIAVPKENISKFVKLKND
jgi:hypothetical protein